MAKPFAENQKILRMEVPKSRGIVSTTEGQVLRRRIMATGKPESVPFYPHEFIQRHIDKHGSIKRDEVAELCHLSLPQAYHLLKKLEKQNIIKKFGKMRHSIYKRCV